jgi:hypothetical protein
MVAKTFRRNEREPKKKVKAELGLKRMLNRWIIFRLTLQAYAKK